MGLYRDQGVVLRTIRLGESDRIVSLVTQGHGKVRAVAKGVRKTKSRFGGRLEPTSHVSLLLYEGRELDVITQAEALDHFRVIREDLDRLARATTMLEAVDQVAQERQPGGRLYEMLVGALRALTARIVDVRTGEVVATATGQGSATRTKLALGGLGLVRAGGAGGLSNGSLSPTEFRDAQLDEAIQRSVAAAADGLVRAAPRLTHVKLEASR